MVKWNKEKYDAKTSRMIQLRQEDLKIIQKDIESRKNDMEQIKTFNNQWQYKAYKEMNRGKGHKIIVGLILVGSVLIGQWPNLQKLIEVFIGW
jgi:hypothetical protein